MKIGYLVARPNYDTGRMEFALVKVAEGLDAKSGDDLAVYVDNGLADRSVVLLALYSDKGVYPKYLKNCPVTDSIFGVWGSLGYTGGTLVVPALKNLQVAKFTDSISHIFSRQSIVFTGEDGEKAAAIKSTGPIGYYSVPPRKSAVFRAVEFTMEVDEKQSSLESGKATFGPYPLTCAPSNETMLEAIFGKDYLKRGCSKASIRSGPLPEKDLLSKSAGLSIKPTISIGTAQPGYQPFTDTIGISARRNEMMTINVNMNTVITVNGKNLNDWTFDQLVGLLEQERKYVARLREINKTDPVSQAITERADEADRNITELVKLIDQRYANPF